MNFFMALSEMHQETQRSTKTGSISDKQGGRMRASIHRFFFFGIFGIQESGVGVKLGVKQHFLEPQNLTLDKRSHIPPKRKRICFFFSSQVPLKGGYVVSAWRVKLLFSK